MPKPITRILLEKKEKLEFNWEQVRDLISNLISVSTANIGQINSINSLSGFFRSSELDSLLEELESIRANLEKWQRDTKKYSWSDPEIQEKLKGYNEKLIVASKEIREKIKKGREQALGKDDSLRIAQKYFETAESLKTKAFQKLSEVSTIRSQQVRIDKMQDNTDILAQNKVDDKLNIVAKSDPKQRVGEGKDEFDKRKKEEAQERNKIKKGLFYYLGNILGLTTGEIEEQWKDDEASKIEKRKFYMKEALPFVEAVMGKTYKKDSPWEDPNYTNDIMILGSYNPAYKNYKASE